MNNKQKVIPIASENETKKLAKKIAAQIKFSQDRSFNLYLSGNLGAGKTTFVRYLLECFGYTDKVKSPTYSLIESYKIENENKQCNIFHLDLYRINSIDELEFLDLKSCFVPNCLVLIEWPEEFLKVLPPFDIFMLFEYDSLVNLNDTQCFESLNQKRIVKLTL